MTLLNDNLFINNLAHVLRRSTLYRILPCLSYFVGTEICHANLFSGCLEVTVDIKSFHPRIGSLFDNLLVCKKALEYHRVGRSSGKLN